MRRRLRPRRIWTKRPRPAGGRAGGEVYREKSAACRHDPDLDWQSADPIKFCFRKAQSLENREWRPVLRRLREIVSAYEPTGRGLKKVLMVTVRLPPI